MKRILVLLFSLAGFVRVQAQVSACGAAPFSIEVKQPDGSMLSVVGKGNANLSYTETTDGFTVVLNTGGVYEYAVINSEGLLIPSGVLAHNPGKRSASELIFVNNTSKNLRHAPAVAMRLKESENISNDKTKTNQLSWGFPATGKKKLLVILIQYPDLQAKFSKDTFEAFMNQPGFAGTGSFKDFYLENSFGKFEVEATVMGWYTAKSTYTTYGKNSGNTAARPLIVEAIDSAEKMGIDFSQFDNDKNGIMDGLLVIHAGNGAEQGSQNQYIWSHRSNLGSLSRTYDGVQIKEYCVTPETRSTVNMVGIGVFVHEFGHILGLPDLYDVSYVSEGIGNWGVMGGGCWLNSEKTPCHFDAWCKMQLGWQQPLVISQEKTYTLPACVDSNISFKILTPNSNEYFLLENMQKSKFDTYLPGKGLAIWHINTDKTSLYPGNNSINTDTTDQGVSLTEADGLRHLDRGSNQGDPGDLFPGAKSKRIFEDESYPSAKMNDGLPSGVKVTEIFETNGIISFYLGKRASNSVQDLGADQLTIYPNPVNQGSNLILCSSKPLTGVCVTISDISGKILKQVLLPDTATLLHEVSVKELSAGIYLMQVSDNTGTTQVKKITIY